MTINTETEASQWLINVAGCDAAIFQKLEQLVELLRNENTRQNLVSARSLEKVWTRHLADSAQLLFVSRETPRGPWLDLGSGAGFPGLVIAVCRPSIDVTVVESRARRISWLEFAAKELGLGNVRIAGTKIEALPSFAANTISARAFAPLQRLISLSARFSTPDTQWLLPKGRNGRQELLQMPKAIQSLFHVERSLTDPDSVVLVGRGVPQIQRERRP